MATKFVASSVAMSKLVDRALYAVQSLRMPRFSISEYVCPAMGGGPTDGEREELIGRRTIRQMNLYTDRQANE